MICRDLKTLKETRKGAYVPMQMNKMNKNGVKLLATMAVFAMLITAVAVVMDESDAAYTLPGDFDSGFIASNNEAVEPRSGDLDEDGALLITADKASYYSKGIKSQGNLTIKIDDGVTLNINATNYAIAVNGTIDIQGKDGSGDTGKLSITVTGEYTAGAVRAAGIVANGAVTINLPEMDVKVNSTNEVASGAYSVGIEAKGATQITCADAEIYGGNKGVYNYSGDATFSGASIIVGAYEKPIRTADGKVSISGSGTKVITKILSGEGVNLNGADDRFGVKTNQIIVASGACLNTQGLYLKAQGNQTVGGSVVITGGYEQESCAAKDVSGLYVNDKTNVNMSFSSVEKVPSTLEDGKVYLVGNVEVYGIDVPGKYSSPSITTTVETLSRDVGTAISSATTSTVNIDLSGKTLTSAALAVEASNKNVILTLPTGMSTVSVAFEDTDSGTVFINLIQTVSYTFTNGTNTMVVSGVDGTVVVERGSVYSTVNITAADPSAGGVISITDNTALTGIVNANVTIQKAQNAQNYNVDLSGLQVMSTKTLTIKDVVVKSTSPINNAGTIAFNEDSTINGALYVDGGYIKGTVNGGNLVISGSVTLANATTVSSGAVLTVSQGALLSANSYTLTNKGTMNVYGDISGMTTKITNDGRIVVLSTSAVLPQVIGGEGIIDSSAVASEGTISGVWKTTTPYSKYQTVTVVGDTTLEDRTTITIYGTLIISEGVTLTIEDGAQIDISYSYAKMINNGTIIIESDKSNGGLDVNGSTVENNGSIMVSAVDPTAAVVDLAANSLFYNNGTFSIDEGNTVVVNGAAKFYNNAGAQTSIYGTFTGTIQNASEVTVDGVITKIVQTADGATVNVISTGDITITDSGFSKYGTNNVTGRANSIAVALDDHIAEVGSFVVKSNVVKPTTEDGAYTKEMVISGALASTYMTGSETSTEYATVTLAETVKVKETLGVSSNILISGTGATLNVSGSVTAEDGAKITVDTLTVTGSVTVGKAAVTSAVNGAMYQVTDVATAAKTFYYTTLANAIDGAVKANVKTVTVTGTNTLKSDVTVPAGLTLKQTSGTITIKNEATLTVAEGGIINQTGTTTAIKVDGTLYVADKKTGVNKNAAIVSQVKSEGEKDVRYTNLNAAIAAAGTEKVTIELNGDVEITTDSTIPANVTVDINDKQFKVKGAILTIDGTLYIDNNTKYTVVNGDAPLNREGKVILNGYIITDIYMTYDGVKAPAGAYYMVGTKYMITSASNADDVIAGAENRSVQLYGKNTVSDLTFTGASDATLTLRISGDLDAGKITVTYTTVVIDSGKNIKAQFTNGDGSLTLKDAKTSAETNKIVASEKDGAKTLTVSGSITYATNKEKTYSAVFDGKVLVKDLTMNADSDGEYYAMTVDGDVTVISGTNSLGFVLVNGTLTVNNGVTMSAAKIDVLGSLVAAAPTESSVAGSISVAKSVIVGAKESVMKTEAMSISGTASVSGSVTYGVLYVIDGTTVDAALTKDKLKTEYYVEGALWMTAYKGTVDTTQIGAVDKAPVKDAYFTKSWSKDSSHFTDAYLIDTETVGSVEKVYAKITYEIYNITVVGDNGIGTVSIDGNLLVKGASSSGTSVGENAFSLPGGAKLKAGNHEITYELKDGYEGTVKIKVNGELISGKTFTLSGTPTSASGIDVLIDISGSVQKDPVAPVQPEKDEGMGITDYLLIVLVILAAILVVIVAIRMMRS